MHSVTRIAASLFLTFCATSLLHGQVSAPKVYENAAPSVVLILCKTPNGQIQGSGVILRPDGVIATNYHVIQGAISARVYLANGDIYDEVSILDTDERKDIAILKVKATSLPVLTTLDSNAVKIGATVYVISNPKGLENSLSSGLISSIRTAEGFRVFQFTAAISPGSSGGALLDDNGRFIGLAFASFRDGQNLNLAIPANYVVPLAVNAKYEGQWLAKMTESAEGFRSSENSAQEIEGTYTGTWDSSDYNASGSLVMRVRVTGEQVEAQISMTGSDYVKDDVVMGKLTSMGAGVWKMDFKTKKSKATGTGIFRDGRFLGDYRYKKFLWVDRGKWRLSKAG
jgi:S1-C subfamily serine protease